MGKKIGTAAVPAVPKGSMESINFWLYVNSWGGIS